MVPCSPYAERACMLTFSCRERPAWRCSHCLVHGSAVWAVRDGPSGPRVSAPLCQSSTTTYVTSHCVITADCSTNATSGFLHGRKTCIVWMFPSERVDDSADLYPPSTSERGRTNIMKARIQVLYGWICITLVALARRSKWAGHLGSRGYELL